MTTDDDDLTMLSRALEQLAELLDGVGSADPSASTPCAEWTLADLVGHLVGGPAKFAQMVRGEQPDWSAAPAPGEPAATFRAGADELRQAWRAADPRAAGPVGMQFAELAVHTYDLATALDRSTASLDPEVAERGLAFLRANLSDELRGAAFAPPQEAPPGADAYGRVAAFAGRTV